MLDFLKILLTKAGLEVQTARNGQDAFKELEKDRYSLVLTDLKMPKINGIDVLVKAKSVDPLCEVIVITAFGTDEKAFEALRLGAYDFMKKPFKNEEVRVVVRRAIEKRRLAEENSRLKSALSDRFDFNELVGTSPAMQEVFDLLRKVSPTKTSLLILGESGTGKELVARAVHYNSPRKDRPFVLVNCGAIPEQLLESELFGHEKGSFTGADHSKPGMFEEADGGTLFLDEVGELPPPLQVKLLRAIQHKTFRRVGGTHDIKVDVRILAATNKDLEQEVQKSRFREDLFYRLNVIQVRLPPLRNRKEDIFLLAMHFLKHFSLELGKPVKGFSKEALNALEAYGYPGNVRELENMIERAVTLEQGELVTMSSLPKRVEKSLITEDMTIPLESQDMINLDSLISRLEKQALQKALERTRWNKTEAAKLLGITFRSFRYRLAKYGLDK
ncbi:MAG: sigma-54-dependent Fis family transcriptional regulator [Deltaproteobacteria bacterium]|nr:sigma-54-dependent Fis family transcriptional regulator [Deltaproteobacteria bacterium]